MVPRPERQKVGRIVHSLRRSTGMGRTNGQTDRTG